jgi:dolichol-phosphate mannosyltransferase
MHRMNLALVMPVYNEEECIADVVHSWYEALASLGMDFQMIILNDGSRDRTASSLDKFRANPRIEIISKPNCGHGPTVLMGYRMATDRAEWVFQTDSDNEMKPDSFPELWERREDYDAVIAFRVNRRQHLTRRIVTSVSRLTTYMLLGKGIRDVNAPYRLIRSCVLKPIIDRIPSDTLTPNIIVSGMLGRMNRRILNYPVPCEGRKTGKGSIFGLRLWRFAVTAFLQCLAWRYAIRGRTGSP